MIGIESTDCSAPVPVLVWGGNGRRGSRPRLNEPPPFATPGPLVQSGGSMGPDARWKATGFCSHSSLR